MNRVTTEPIRWSGYPSWKQFTWLYFLSAMTGFRAVLFYRFNLPGWEMWFIGTALLLGCAAMLRRWARYIITPSRLVVRNGYTGRDIHTMSLDQVGEVTIRQGPIAAMTGIGTIEVHHIAHHDVLRFRGVAEPDVVKNRIVALRPPRETQRLAP